MDDQKLKQILEDIYRRLFKTYGPQHWWPAETPFEVIIGAILTQSASWHNVEKAVASLKKAGALSPMAIRRLPQAEIARLIFPSGYYNSKARKLKAFVSWLGANYNDNLDTLFSLNTGDLRVQLLSIYGIGEETADSIILYAGNKPVFVIDAYTRRIIDRIGLKPHPTVYRDYQKLFMENLQADAAYFNEYHALLVRLGKEVCRKTPVCIQCCLKTLCFKSKNPRH